jgi:hypothetical protein
MQKFILAVLCIFLASCGAANESTQSNEGASQVAAVDKIAQTDADKVKIQLILPKSAVPSSLVAAGDGDKPTAGTPVTAEEMAALTSFLSAAAKPEKLGPGCFKVKSCECEVIDGHKVCACTTEIFCPD